MKEVNIYFGPKKEFNNTISREQNIVTLTELAQKSDSKRRAFKHFFQSNGEVNYDIDDELEYIQCLVAYSDEYAGISESAIQSFISFISSFEIEKIYLQNPPTYILNQIKKLKVDIKTERYQYKTVDIDVLKKIDKEFDQNIVGQQRVKRSLITSLYPLTKNSFVKPIVLLFYGSTGVGKTETAKFLSLLLNEKLFRKQFSMFQNNDFYTYVFGGKINQDSLSKELLERESNIILLDEFDKPHPTFHSAFYQLFDEGIYVDKNYNVELKRSIIICTSNYMSEDDIRKKLGEPIFSRFDAVIKFEKLTLEDIKKIISNEYKKQFELLDDFEKEIVVNNLILEKILNVAKSIKDVRHIKRIIRDTISRVILNEILY